GITARITAIAGIIARFTGVDRAVVDEFVARLNELIDARLIEAEQAVADAGRGFTRPRGGVAHWAVGPMRAGDPRLLGLAVALKERGLVEDEIVAELTLVKTPRDPASKISANEISAPEPGKKKDASGQLVRSRLVGPGSSPPEPVPDARQVRVI